MPGRSMGPRLAAALLLAGAAPVAAQTLAVPANPVTIASPTEVQYDAAPPGNVTAATSMTMTLVCPGGGTTGCEIDWSYNGATLLVDYQVTAASGCNAGFITASFAAVPAIPTKLVDRNKGGTCTITVLVRVRGLAYSVQQAATTYLQGITLVGKRQ
jgi:hypothetical protein